jgi:hypothetical protein
MRPYMSYISKRSREIHASRRPGEEAPHRPFSSSPFAPTITTFTVGIIMFLGSLIVMSARRAHLPIPEAVFMMVGLGLVFLAIIMGIFSGIIIGVSKYKKSKRSQGDPS